MSSRTSGGTNARHDVEKYLRNNGGWHEVSTISAATGYSHGHTRSTAKSLSNNKGSPVEGRKNHGKPVIGYYISGYPNNPAVPGGSRQEVIRLIKVYGNSTPNFSAMTLDDLFSHLRSNVANSVARLSHKWEFRVP